MVSPFTYDVPALKQLMHSTKIVEGPITWWPRDNYLNQKEREALKKRKQGLKQKEERPQQQKQLRRDGILSPQKREALKKLKQQQRKQKQKEGRIGDGIVVKTARQKEQRQKTKEGGKHGRSFGNAAVFRRGKQAKHTTSA